MTVICAWQIALALAPPSVDAHDEDIATGLENSLSRNTEGAAA